MIKSFWVIGSKQIMFSIENKTDHSIKLIWDEAAYMDEDSQSRRVLHEGVKYSEKNSPSPPSVIMKNGILNDIIVPTDNVYYISGEYGGWRTHPLFPQNPIYGWDSLPEDSETAYANVEKLAKGQKGKRVRVLLPLQIGEVVNEYLFTFVVDGYKIEPMESAKLF